MKAVLNLIAVCFFFNLNGIIFSQNLIKNPSFEDYFECPNTLGTFNEHVKSWSTPTGGTTDYFNTCSTVMSAPENFNGIQHTKDGKAYSGLYFYAPGDYREYIQVELMRKLRPNKKYELSFYISLAEGSDFAVKDFGVVCAYKQISIATKKVLSKGRLYSIKGNKFHSFEINHPKFHEDKTDWLKVSTSFIAKGYEKYILIGNIRNNKLTRKVQTKRKESKKGAYYYIDLVSLTQEGIDLEPEFELEKVHQLEHLLFDFDAFKLDETAKVTLKELYNYLKENTEITITIIGHTDNQGGNDYNQVLSEKRAKAVVNYFVKLGLSKQRISHKGNGSRIPKDTNNTPEGKKNNRRVEFILKKE